MDIESIAFHFPEPGHLPFSKLMNGHVQLLHHFLIAQLSVRVQRQVFIFQTVINQIFGASHHFAKSASTSSTMACCKRACNRCVMRITQRLHARLQQGMVEEVERILQSGVKPEDLIYYGLEYKYLTLYLTGQLGYEEMVQQLNVAIHQFAKRQMTWFRKMERDGFDIHWLESGIPMEEKVEVVKRWWLTPDN